MHDCEGHPRCLLGTPTRDGKGPCAGGEAHGTVLTSHGIHPISTTRPLPPGMRSRYEASLYHGNKGSQEGQQGADCAIQHSERTDVNLHHSIGDIPREWKRHGTTLQQCKGEGYVLSKNSMESRWFEYFIRGMSACKGDEVDQDQAYTIEVLHELIQMYDDEWETWEGKPPLGFCMFLIASCKGGCRGYETVRTDL